MLIAGIQKTTLVDYPDKLACIIFTAGCNLRCRFCHNPELVLPEHIKQQEILPEENFFKFLETKKELLDGVVISGGEPSLQRDLASFCRRIKKLGLLVKLDTNGRDPRLLASLIEDSLVDYIAMDIKVDEAQWFSLLQKKEKIHPYMQSMQLLLKNTLPYEFRTTLIKPYHTHEHFTQLLSYITGAKKYYLQTYRSTVTLDPNFDGKAFTHAEMQQLANEARAYVEECIVR